jgi:carbamoyltransferase
MRRECYDRIPSRRFLATRHLLCSMTLIAGIAGALRNAAASLCDNGHIVAVCEQERVTRTRRAALRQGRLPTETLDTILRIGGREIADVSTYAVAETAIDLPSDLPVERVEHHRAHAATSFFTSPFADAVVLVCDRHGEPELSVWRGDRSGVTRLDFPWNGPAFAAVYSRAAQAFGFAPDGDEHRLEALAHVADRPADAALSLVASDGKSLEVSSQFSACIASLVRSVGSGDGLPAAARVANGVQRSLGESLVHVVRAIRSRFGGRHLCLGGGLFYNSYFNTVVAQSDVYEHTFVPVNPGNAGIAVGAALEVAGKDRPPPGAMPLSPFLGPGYDAGEIKAILENCKLSYDYVHGGQVIERAARAISQGKLVAWFQGRMEWGPRALGNRSILVSPVAPFVLENLNVFLKHRAPHRSYSVSVCAEDAPRYFRGPPTSHFMEYEYEVIDAEVLRALLPLNSTRLRVQTVPESAGSFHTLIKAFGDLTGVPIVVNTSFNGFAEPIVCTPRDAVRVFYGTGLDMAVIGRFVLQK